MASIMLSGPAAGGKTAEEARRLLAGGLRADGHAVDFQNFVAARTLGHRESNQLTGRYPARRPQDASRSAHGGICR